MRSPACLRVLLYVASVAVASQSAFAAYSCNGVIDQVNVSPNGVVIVDSTAAGLQSVYLCQIGTTANGVSPDACKAILSLILAAKLSGASVLWSFSDSLTCTTHPAWAWLGGWYYGPNLN
jgi:hypothetical protein